MFSMDHHSSSKPTTYFQIHTDLEDEPLELSKNHLVFIDGKDYPVPASTIQVGDKVFSMYGPREVLSVTRIVREGRYNPLTMDGTIVVDGIIASTYNSPTGESHLKIGDKKTSVSFHDAVETACVPYRMFCSIAGLDFCNLHKQKSATGVYMHLFFRNW